MSHHHPAFCCWGIWMLNFFWRKQQWLLIKKFPNRDLSELSKIESRNLPKFQNQRMACTYFFPALHPFYSSIDKTEIFTNLAWFQSIILTKLNETLMIRSLSQKRVILIQKKPSRKFRYHNNENFIWSKLNIRNFGIAVSTLSASSSRWVC